MVLILKDILSLGSSCDGMKFMCIHWYYARCCLLSDIFVPTVRVTTTNVLAA